MIRILILLSTFLLNSCCWWSCNDDPNTNKDEWNDDGVQISKKYLWKVPLEYTYIVDKNNKGHGYVNAGANLYYKNGYLVGSNPEPAKSYYEFREIETGKLIWQIPNDVVNSRGYNMGITLYNIRTYQWQHYVVATPYYPICFNLKTGKIQWRLENAKYWEFIKTGFEDKIFFQREYEKDTYALYEADILTGNHQEFMRFPPDNIIAGLKFFKDEKGDLLFVLVVIDFSKDKSYISLYNYTRKKWEYKDMPVKKGAATGHIQLYKDKIFLMGMQGFACHRLSTGKEIWSDSSYNTAVNSGPWHEGAVLGNKLIVAMGDDFLMCLNMDANYKDIIWENHKYGVGNSVSPFHILNGVLYFAGKARICAIDPHTGKFLWFLKSPDLQEYGRGAFFKGDIWVIPGKDGKKGRIITSTYRSGVCYEAIK